MVSGERTVLSSGELEGRWNAFFENADIRRRIVQVAQAYPAERSVLIDFPDLDAWDNSLADNLLDRPSAALKAGEKALLDLLPESLVPISPIHLRVRGLPAAARIPIHQIREKHLGKLLALEGMIRKASEVRPQILEGAFKCAACGAEVRLAQEESSPVYQDPVKCDSCGKPIGKTRFTLDPEACTYIDSQRVEVQENPEKLKGGSQPQGLPVLLLDDLTGDVIPGHRVVVTGILRGIPKNSAGKGSGRPVVFDLLLMANSVEKEDREYQEIEISEVDRAAIEALRGDKELFQKIVGSLAPTMQKMEREKEAITLQLFGGVSKVHPDGIKTRGDIHVLLVGDPSTGKSQLLRHVAENIAPRGIYTSGKGSSAAGLTAAVVKDDFAGGRWSLEAGAMVLADQGILMVDELDKMNENDRSALHEGLEQQTISIAKAGITATLKARCPVLAAANPKTGRFQPKEDEPLIQQVELTPPLLSRFDMIFALLDKPNQAEDRLMAEAVLTKHQEAETRESIGSRPGNSPPTRATTGFQPEFMRKYIAYAKQHVHPVMEDSAKKIIEDFYVTLRSKTQGESHAVAITVRQVEGMVRLAEASARARLSPLVAAEDANRAVELMNHYLRSMLTTKSGGPLDIDYIAVGTPASYRDQLGVVRDIMRALQKANPAGFSVDQVVEAAEREKKMDRGKVLRLIDEIKRMNEVYEPRRGTKPETLRLMD